MYKEKGENRRKPELPISAPHLRKLRAAPPPAAHPCFRFAAAAAAAVGSGRVHGPVHNTNNMFYPMCPTQDNCVCAQGKRGAVVDIIGCVALSNVALSNKLPHSFRYHACPSKKVGRL